MLKVKKLSEHALLPYRASKYAAGLDLYSAYDYIVPSKGKQLLKTDIMIEIPVGHYGRIAPRFSLALKNYIDVGAGVIDSDYRGNICVLLFNHSDSDFIIHHGDRIVQLIMEKISILEVEETSYIDDTERGMGGFGSTGK